MMEYFAYKKFKKNKADKEEKVKGKQPEELPSPSTAGVATPSTSAATPTTTTPTKPTAILDDDDEQFLEKLTSFFHDHKDDDDDAKPTLPPRVATPDISQIWDSDSESFRREERVTPSTTTATATETKEKPSQTATKKPNRLSVLLRRVHPSKKTTSTDLVPTNTSDKSKLAVPSPEVDTERDDLTRVLDDLNLSAKNNKAFSLSAESTELLQKFTLVLKDLVNGVPTAVHDLTSLLDDKDGTLADNYEKLPSSLKKLVTQLPEKLTSTLAPELLAVAAEAQGLSAAEAGAAGAGAAGLKGAAKKLMTPRNLKDLVTKPGAVVSMLKGIMNALKLRWPAFIGTNVIWSLALFLLLFVLWYCHKRGREVRLEREKSEAGGVVDGAERIEELPDDPALPAPPTAAVKTIETPVVLEPVSR